MSKDKEPKEPKAQQMIDGAGDKPTPRVAAAARKYAKTLNERMALQEDEAVLKPALDKIMLEDSVEKLEVGFTNREENFRYEVKRSKVEASSKVTCKKIEGEE